MSIFVGCGHESKSVISNYKGDGTIKYLSGHGLFGIDGIELKFEKFDLSKDFNAKYSLHNLPVGDVYMVYLAIPNPAPLHKIMQNQLNMRIINRGTIVQDINLPIGRLINNETAEENKFYALKGFHSLEVSGEIEVRSGDEYALEIFYKNNHVVDQMYGSILIERGGFK